LTTLAASAATGLGTGKSKARVFAQVSAAGTRLRVTLYHSLIHAEWFAMRRRGPLCSSYNGGATDAADLELLAFPPRNRNEEQRELLELPHPRPLRGVAAARTSADFPRPKILTFGAVAEEQEQHDTQDRGGASTFACTGLVIRTLLWECSTARSRHGGSAHAHSGAVRLGGV
jgi:hypothetical protein